MKRLILAALLLPLAALATNKPPPPKPEPKPVPITQTQHADATAVAGAKSSSDSTAISGSKSHAEGGDATSIAKGGDGGNASQEQTANGGEANNAGNEQNLSITSEYERSAPSVAQGSLYIPNCGAAGNAGGSNTNGSGFLGFAYTPEDCKLLLAAAAFQSLGMYDSACEMVNGISAVKKRWKALNMQPPSCAMKTSSLSLGDPAEPEFDPTMYMTREEAKNFLTQKDLDERDKRMLKRLGK